LGYWFTQGPEEGIDRSAGFVEGVGEQSGLKNDFFLVKRLFSGILMILGVGSIGYISLTKISEVF